MRFEYNSLWDNESTLSKVIDIEGHGPDGHDPIFADHLRGLRITAPIATYNGQPARWRTLYVWAWGHDVLSINAVDRLCQRAGMVQ
jgi:hypothetical protein